MSQGGKPQGTDSESDPVPSLHPRVHLPLHQIQRAAPKPGEPGEPPRRSASQDTELDTEGQRERESTDEQSGTNPGAFCNHSPNLAASQTPGTLEDHGAGQVVLGPGHALCMRSAHASPDSHNCWRVFSATSLRTRLIISISNKFPGNARGHFENDRTTRFSRLQILPPSIQLTQPC